MIGILVRLDDGSSREIDNVVVVIVVSITLVEIPFVDIIVTV
jgi:hypothetical protein